MNERIQELKDKAWATCEEPEQYMDKFAELIVKECAEVGYDTHDDFQVKVNIKKHFGVQ